VLASELFASGSPAQAAPTARRLSSSVRHAPTVVPASRQRHGRRERGRKSRAYPTKRNRRVL